MSFQIQRVEHTLDAFNQIYKPENQKVKEKVKTDYDDFEIIEDDSKKPVNPKEVEQLCSNPKKEVVPAENKVIPMDDTSRKLDELVQKKFEELFSRIEKQDVKIHDLKRENSDQEREIKALKFDNQEFKNVIQNQNIKINTLTQERSDRDIEIKDLKLEMKKQAEVYTARFQKQDEIIYDLNIKLFAKENERATLNQELEKLKLKNKQLTGVAKLIRQSNEKKTKELEELNLKSQQLELEKNQAILDQKNLRQEFDEEKNKALQDQAKLNQLNQELKDKNIQEIQYSKQLKQDYDKLAEERNDYKLQAGLHKSDYELEKTQKNAVENQKQLLEKDFKELQETSAFLLNKLQKTKDKVKDLKFMHNLELEDLNVLQMKAQIQQLQHENAGLSRISKSNQKIAVMLVEGNYLNVNPYEDYIADDWQPSLPQVEIALFNLMKDKDQAMKDKDLSNNDKNAILHDFNKICDDFGLPEGSSLAEVEKEIYQFSNRVILEIRQLNNQVENLNDQILAFKQTNGDLENQNNELMQENAGLQGRVRMLSNENTKLHSNEMFYEQQNAVLKMMSEKNIKESQGIIDGLNQQKVRLEKEMELLRQKHNRLLSGKYNPKDLAEMINAPFAKVK